MGWPKKDERLRLYFERKAKSYLLIDVDESREMQKLRLSDYAGIGEVMIDNNPARPMLATTTVSAMHLYRHCRRAQWSDMPEVWQRALADWLTEPPENYRGLWKVKEQNP
jgi:hypothetical protein